MPEEILSQKWDPRHSIMTCHWFLGSLWFCLTSHQLPASSRFYWVEISLKLSRLIIPSKVRLSPRRLHTAAFIPHFPEYAITSYYPAENGAFLSWDLQSIAVNNKVFLVGWLTSANISVIRGETLPDLTMRSWYDICQPVVLVISFSVARLDSAEPFM